MRVFKPTNAHLNGLNLRLSITVRRKRMAMLDLFYRRGYLAHWRHLVELGISLSSIIRLAEALTA